MVGTRMPEKARRSTTLRWIAVVVVALVLFVVLWVAIRALMARDELLSAIPIARSVGSSGLSVIGGDVSDEVEDLQNHAARAESLTSDVVWRAAEFVPFAGPNLTAFREAASMIDDVATEALPPLVELTQTFTLDSLSPRDGAFDLQVFTDASPLLEQSSQALNEAGAMADEIDTTDTIQQIGTAVDQVKSLVAQARDAVSGLNTAARLLPPMLGGSEQRSYLLLSLNNSELRSAGGIPGAVAIVNASQGRVELGELSSANELGEFATAPLELTVQESTLYNETMGTYLQNVTSTPNFARSAELAQAMWEERTGQTVDGVITLDPVATGYLLNATGPIDAGAGISLNAGNAADFLLSRVYSTFVDPADQDKFFANVTGTVFSAVTSGQADSESLIEALTRSAQESRVQLWSAGADEQSELSGLPIAGELPLSTSETTAFGVYLNDSTGGKMDYYLSSSVGIASAVCRNDERPNFEVKVQLTSSAPGDAATSLPSYVTAEGAFGVPAGNIGTNVYVYAPSGSIPYSVTIDGQEYSFVASEHEGSSVAGVNVELVPGQSSIISMKFVGLTGAAQAVTLDHTPMASAVETSLDNYLDCSDIAPAPTEDEVEQTQSLSADPAAARDVNSPN
jgi:hypothetical protein